MSAARAAALEAVQAETDAETESDDGSALIELSVTDRRGKVEVAAIRVPPPGRWRTRANRALRQGDFDEWAELVLSEEDYEAWAELDPTNDEVDAFFAAWKDTSGQELGKSRASRRSSRNTARR